jgi:hypothetical protein
VSDALRPRPVANDDDTASADDAAEVVGEEAAPAPARAASGGYGTPSDRASSGGSGDGTEDTSNAGDDDQTNWLRDAPGGGDER